MYERMLDKSNKPTLQEMINYCGTAGTVLEHLNHHMNENYGTELEIRFPYGNHYGWGIKHKLKNKHICDIFAEKEAFTVMIRLTNKQIDNIYSNLSKYAKDICDHKYPCSEGGWLYYRITCDEHMEDAFRILNAKLN